MVSNRGGSCGRRFPWLCEHVMAKRLGRGFYRVKVSRIFFFWVADAEQVDIGLPYHRPHRTKEVRERRQVMKDNKNNAELERALRRRTCKLTHILTNIAFSQKVTVLLRFSISYPPVKIPLDRVQETWEKGSGPFHIKRLAEHYGIFRDLFPMAYFLPQVPLRICHSQDNSGQVHYGNRLTPTEVR